MSQSAKYTKFIVALIGGAVAVLTSLYGVDNTWVTTLVSLGTALGVYQFPNDTNEDK